MSVISDMVKKIKMRHFGESKELPFKIDEKPVKPPVDPVPPINPIPVPKPINPPVEDK